MLACAKFIDIFMPHLKVFGVDNIMQMGLFGTFYETRTFAAKANGFKVQCSIQRPNSRWSLTSGTLFHVIQSQEAKSTPELF